MRANRVIRKIRLENRIRKLENKLDASWGSFGHGNPYRRCKGCNIAEPQISYDGHGKHCPFKGIKKEIEHYEQLLKLME